MKCSLYSYTSFMFTTKHEENQRGIFPTARPVKGLLEDWILSRTDSSKDIPTFSGGEKPQRPQVPIRVYFFRPLNNTNVNWTIRSSLLFKINLKQINE